MTVSELKNQIELAKTELDNAAASGKPTVKARERLKNVLANHVNEIVEALSGTGDSAKVEELEAKIAGLEEENEALGDALAESDAKVKALTQELAAVKPEKKSKAAADKV